MSCRCAAARHGVAHAPLARLHPDRSADRDRAARAGLALAFATHAQRHRATAARRGDGRSAANACARSQGFLRTQLAARVPVPFEFDDDDRRAPRFLGEPRSAALRRRPARLPGARRPLPADRLELVRGDDGAAPAVPAPAAGRRRRRRGRSRDRRRCCWTASRDGALQMRSLDAGRRPGAWQDNWEIAGQLPLLVRSDAALRRDARRDWPPSWWWRCALGAAYAATPPVHAARRDGISA